MKYTGWTRIKNHDVYVSDGKCTWATDDRGWHQDILTVDGTIINGKYAECTLRKMINEGKVVFK